ncbi:MAG: hypothetical protein ACP5KN_06225 [Armatimonadota bacterium]
MSKPGIAAVIAALIAATGVAVAQDYANIVVGGEVVARIRTGGPYGSIYQRQAKIDQRITEALSAELASIFDREADGPDLDVNKVDGHWTLSIGNTMLIQALSEDAAPLGCSTKELVYQWRENFHRQLPKAVSPIKVPGWWKERHPDSLPQIEKKPHGLPDHDAPLVREIVGLLDAARALPQEQFEELEPTLKRSILQRIWTYRHPQCGSPPAEVPRRVDSALTRVRATSDEQHAAEKWWIAGLTIRAVRKGLKMASGVGAVPEQRPLPSFVAAATHETPPDEAISSREPAPPRLVPGTCIHQAAIGMELDANNRVTERGQVFPASVPQLLVFVHVRDAKPNSILGVILRKDGTILGRRLVRVGGERRMAVTFYPAHSEMFSAGDYECLLQVNGEDAGVIPFRIGP